MAKTKYYIQLSEQERALLTKIICEKNHIPQLPYIVLYNDNEVQNIPFDYPVIVKPIEEMENYEVAVCNGGEEAFYYTFDKNELKDKLNSILKEKGKQKSLTKRTKNTTN